MNRWPDIVLQDFLVDGIIHGSLPAPPPEVHNQLFSFAHCSNVRMKEGSGPGWLVETRDWLVILLPFSINLNRCALCTSSVHQLSRLSQRSLSAFVLAVSLITDHAPESPLRLSLNSRSTVTFIRSRQLLQSDTGVPHFALDPLTYRRLLSLSPAADFAEPRPPRHTHVKRETVVLAP